MLNSSKLAFKSLINVLIIYKNKKSILDKQYFEATLLFWGTPNCDTGKVRK